jgi:glycosyltransferase involved in cell wall biosynthesis
VFRRYDSLSYRIAGGGHYLSTLRDHVTASPYSDRIEVLGHRSDIPDFLSGSDLFVYVSYLDSISTAVLEAQAAGLLVIGGDVVGVPTAVGDAGRLCEPTSIEVERAVLDISAIALIVKSWHGRAKSG